MESENVNFDEFIEGHEAKPMKEPKEYKSFLYVYEVMPTIGDDVNQVTNRQKVWVIIK